MHVHVHVPKVLCFSKLHFPTMFMILDAPSLRYLNLSDVRSESTCIGLMKIAHCCPNLVSLNLRGSTSGHKHWKQVGLNGIHVISPYFGGSSLYFVYFPENLPTKIFRISYISYTSLYLEFQISLPNFKNSLLCLIILPIWKTKSPYLSSGMYHMYVERLKLNHRARSIFIHLNLCCGY